MKRLAYALLIYCIAFPCCLVRFIVSSFQSEARQFVELKLSKSALVRMCSRSLHYNNGTNDKRILPTPVSREGPLYRISIFEDAQLVEQVRHHRLCASRQCFSGGARTPAVTLSFPFPTVDFLAALRSSSTVLYPDLY